MFSRISRPLVAIRVLYSRDPRSNRQTPWRAIPDCAHWSQTGGSCDSSAADIAGCTIPLDHVWPRDIRIYELLDGQYERHRGRLICRQLIYMEAVQVHTMPVI